tara:strand:+ start:3814 stop:4716 length:903 start_codon:yes stop_codon:yes gene_type:complete
MDYSGILLLDKPSGISSHDLVAITRKDLGMKQVGHAGTLDPLASGLMVLLLGEATKISDYVLSDDKSYECEILLGQTTDTLDIDGKATSNKEVDLDLDTILQVAKSLKGDFEWEIPLYSAKKIKGKKLYELAREDIEIATKPTKLMSFSSVEVLSYEKPYVRVHLKCSKGSFVRTWVNEFGKKLGCGACVSALRRKSSGSFHIDHAITTEHLKNRNFGKSYIDINRALTKFPAIEIRGIDRHLVRNGQISHLLQARLAMVDRYQEQVVDVIKLVDDRSKLLALVNRGRGGRFRFRRVFQA